MATDAALNVIHPSGERTRILLHPLPFRIGRGPENDLILRDNRASRTHAWIVFVGGQDSSGSYWIEDLESTHGTWINGERIHRQTKLESGNTVHFGFEDSYRLIFSRTSDGLKRLVGQLEESSPTGGATSRLARLRSVIAVARTLQTSPAVDDVLAAVIDAALALTGAERGFVLLKSGDALEFRGGQDKNGSTLGPADLNVPPSVIFRALRERRELLFMNLTQRDMEQAGQTFAKTAFRNVICVPLVQFRGLNTQQTLALSAQSDTVGVIYLDSRAEQTPLSELNRELLHTLALEASTVLENAKLLEEERQKLLLERELAVAREIQQSLLPGQLPSDGWFRAAGSNLPSAKVSGDYFDVRAVNTDSWAAVVADVSGKGISSALLASLLQGAFLLASELAISLDELMSKVNMFLTERARGEKYATLFYATIRQSGEMIWANAGHCAPLLIRAGGKVEELSPTGMPLGLLPKTTFEVKRLQLDAGDTIVAFSDGLTEAENADGETFGGKLRPALALAFGQSAQQIHDLLVQSVESFAAGSVPQDDVTLLVIEYRGSTS